MKAIEVFFYRIYFGVYYPWYFLDTLWYGNGFANRVIKVRKFLHISVDEKSIHEEKEFPMLLSDFCSMQIVNLFVGITMCLPLIIISSELLHPKGPVAAIFLWGGIFVFYLYATYLLFSKNDNKKKYIAKFLKEPVRKRWTWAIISSLILIVVWGTTIIIYKYIHGTL